VLTAKGELHGGHYQDSPRYGRYIVWPESLIEHPLIVAIESNQRIFPGGMRRYYPHLSAAQINATLRELGLQRSTSMGTQLTPLGERFGGRQERDDEHALFVVSWPHEIVDNPVIHRELNRIAGAGQKEPAGDDEPGASPTQGVDASAPASPVDDLFASLPEAPPRDRSPAQGHRRALDGHLVDSLLQLRVCDWLYEAQLAHAHHRRLPVEEDLSVDFYVPVPRLYIECWENEVPTAELSRRLRTREVCRDLGLTYVEVAAADIDRVGVVLGTAVERARG
jgi:hypothetical protein